MNDRIDFELVRTLLRKQRQERRFIFSKGNFDAVGLLLRLLLVAAFVAIFIVYFGQFAGIYLAIPTNNRADPMQRLYELLSIAYTGILVLMTVSCVTAILRELFLADDIKIFSAMPVGAKTLFVAKLVSIYRGQLLFALVTVLTVNISVLTVMAQGAWLYIMTVAVCLVLPVISIAIASIFALPFYAIRQFLQPRFTLLFITITLFTAGAIVVYSFILTAMKDLMVGVDFSSVFNGHTMSVIKVVVSYLYPCNWISSFLLGHEFVYDTIGIILLVAACAVVSMLIIRRILTRALQARISGDENFMYREQDVATKGSSFGSLMKKEFLVIFRTPAYMFSYFSVAVLMPLMVFFCMDIGASMVRDKIGIDCTLELALFLTLLFSALTNVFCSTNISREGTMFYSVKALPISHTSVVFSKVLFCMIVSVISQMISAVVLFWAGQVTWQIALFVFGIGTVFSFAQICFATRYDFNHAKFSTEDDGEIKESSGTVSTLIVLGMVVSFVIGAVVLIVRLMFVRDASMGYLSYVIASAITVVIAAVSYLYLVCRLKKKYYEFSGGGLF